MTDQIDRQAIEDLCGKIQTAINTSGEHPIGKAIAAIFVAAYTADRAGLEAGIATSLFADHLDHARSN